MLVLNKKNPLDTFQTDLVFYCCNYFLIKETILWTKVSEMGRVSLL